MSEKITIKYDGATISIAPITLAFAEKLLVSLKGCELHSTFGIDSNAFACTPGDELGCSAEFTEHNFVLSEYTDASGRKLPCYQITRDGFAFLAMGFTGKRAARFKEAYINAFNLMEKSLSGADASDMSAVARNARGVYLHLREIHQIWTSQLYPMLKAVESPLASKLYDRVGDAVFGAALVDSRLNGSDKEVRP